MQYCGKAGGIKLSEAHCIQYNIWGGSAAFERNKTLTNFGGALEVLRYIQDEFKCEECEAIGNPFSEEELPFLEPLLSTAFSLDTFFVALGKLPVSIQCIMCQGTHYMVLSISNAHRPLSEEEEQNSRER